MELIGFKVILKAMDWSANRVARARKEPPGKGAWNLLSNTKSFLAVSRATHFQLSDGVLLGVAMTSGYLSTVEFRRRHCTINRKPR